MPVPSTSPPHKKAKLSAASIAKINAITPKMVKCKGVASLYSEFCEENQAELSGGPDVGPLVKTTVGRMYLTDAAAKAYLVHLSGTNTAGAVSTKFTELKAGLRSLSLSAAVFPAWAVPDATAPPLVREFLKDMKMGTYKGDRIAKEKGAIAPEEMQVYVVSKIMDDLEEPIPVSEVRELLYMWCSIGKGQRFVNLHQLKLTDAGYEAGDEDAGDVPYLNAANTKAVASYRGRQAAEAVLVSKVTLGDVVSRYLFSVYWANVPTDALDDPNSYFFPALVGDELKWDKPISRPEVDAAVLECARALKLVHSKEHAQAFTSKSLRCGIAGDVAGVVQNVLGRINPTYGWASNSTLPLSAYCTDKVLTTPGLLHTDLEAISTYYTQAMEGRFFPKRYDMVCSACGYPNCECPKCNAIMAGGLGKTKRHTCWLEGRKAGKKSKKWIDENEDQYNERHAAWETYGLAAPLYVDGAFGFCD